MTTHLPTETELVLLLCRTPIAARATVRVSALLAQPVDWDALFHRAAVWELEAVVFSNLRCVFGEAIPLKVLELVTDLERQSRAHTLARTLVTVDLAAKFDAHGIDSLVLKGPAVGVAAYGDPSLRSFDDIDLLVRRQDLERARDLLTTIGYARQYEPSHESFLIDQHHALEFSNSRTRVELHSALLERYLRLTIPENDLWNGDLRIQCAGGTLRVLAQHHLFLFLCAHGAKHEWERPRWIRDIAQLLQMLDAAAAARILDLAERTHAKRLVALGLRLARDMFDADISLFPDSRLVPESGTRRLVDLVLGRAGLVEAAPSRTASGRLLRHDPNIGPLIFWAAARERNIDKIACIARVLLVPTLSDEGPRALRWASRPLRLAARFFRRSARA